MTPRAPHSLDVDLDFEPDEVASRPPRVLPKLAAVFRRQRRLLRGERP